MSSKLHENAEWQDAVAREREIREGAYLGLPTLFADGAISLPPLTLRQQQTLLIARNPIVCGGEVTENDAVAFLWALHPAYSLDNGGVKRAYFAELESLDLDWLEVIEELRGYYAEQRLDSPTMGVQDRGEPQAPAICGATAYVDLFANAYGWTRAEVLDSPLVCLNGERRAMAMRGPLAVVSVRPAKSHGISGGFLSNAAQKRWVEARRAARAKEVATNG